MPPIRSSFILFITAICLIEPNSGRVPYQGRRYQGGPQNVSGQPYAGYRAWRNGEPIDDRITDDEDIDEDLNNQEGPYLWNREEYPNPILQPPFCRNMHPSHVCDPDDILSRREKLSLEKMIRRINTDVNCYCANCTIDSNGITIGVALMKAMHKPYLMRARDYVPDYAEFLRKKWNLGICDNDMVLLVSTTDRLRYPALGSTTKEIIPQKVIDKLMNDTKQNFAASLYHGLESLIVGLHEELIKLQTVEESTTAEPLAGDGAGKPAEESNIALILGITFLILALLILTIFCIICGLKWRRNRRRRYEPNQKRDIVKKNPDAENDQAEERRTPDEVDEDDENNQEAQESQRRVRRSWLQPVTSSIRQSWTQVKAISFRKKRTSGEAEVVQEYQSVETTEQRVAPKATGEYDEDEERFSVPEGLTGRETGDGDEEGKKIPVHVETTQPLQSNL